MLLAALLGGTAAGLVPDDELMRRVVDHDSEGLEQLYDRYSRAVYSLLLRVTGQAASADELLQEVFLRLWNSAPTYRAARGALGPWLLTLARHIAIDHIRSKAEKQRRQEDPAADPPSGMSVPRPEEWLDQLRLAERVQRLMSKLPESEKKALELAYFKGLSQSEIAASMDQPLGTVKTWIRSALRRLRLALEEEAA